MISYFATMKECVIEVTRRNEKWQFTRHLEHTSPLCVTTTPSGIYVGTLNDGLFRSSDSGDSWVAIGTEMDSRRITALAIDTENRIWAGTEPTKLYRSDDGGDTWTEITGIDALPSAPEWSYPLRPETHNAHWIEPDPAVPDRMYVCVEQGAVVQTTDGGQTWSDRVPDSPRDVHVLRTHPDAPGRLYAATGDGAERPGMGYAESHDYGESWQYPNDGLDKQYLMSVAVDAEDPDVVLVSASTAPRQTDDFDVISSGVYRRIGKDSWERCVSGLPDETGLTPPTLTASSDEPGRFFAATNRGVFRTDDYGTSWKRLETEWPEEFRNQFPRSVAVSE